MNRTNIWIVQGGSRSGFTTESFQSFGITREFIRKKLEGDEPPERGVLGFIDDTRAATTELVEDAVVRDGLSDQR